MLFRFLGSIGPAVLSQALALPAMAQPSRTEWAQNSCERIAKTYGSCGSHFQFDGYDFDFPLRSGRTQVPCTDGKDLEYYDRIERMDVASTFMFPYQTGVVKLPETRRNWDPGRLRVEPLLKAVYGENESGVRTNLVKITFLNQVISFQKNLGAAAALEKVGIELQAEAGRDASLAKFLEPFTSKKVDLRLYAFGWRTVKGTTRLSTHSFGTGIDLLTNDGPQYWLWDEQKTNPEKAKQGEIAYRDTHFIPRGAPRFHAKAVEIFERNGFIWGGKWNHYDTMHFEYRPEFFASVTVRCPRTIEPRLAYQLPEGWDSHAHDHGHALVPEATDMMVRSNIRTVYEAPSSEETFPAHMNEH